MCRVWYTGVIQPKLQYYFSTFINDFSFSTLTSLRFCDVSNWYMFVMSYNIHFTRSLNRDYDQVYGGG